MMRASGADKLSFYADGSISAIDGNTNPLVFALGTAGEQMRLNSTGLEVKGKLAVGYSDFSGIPTNGAAFAGSVGIGTSSPSTKLHTSIDSATIGARFQSTGSAVESLIEFKDPGTTADFQVRVGSNGDNLRFYAGGTTRATLDSSGNLGLGVVPSAWPSGQAAMQFKFGGLSTWALGGVNGYIYSNAYYDGSTNKYVNDGTACSYAINNGTGVHAWFIAPSGTAGNTITFTQAMTLTAAGNLGVGSTSPISKVEINSGTSTAPTLSVYSVKSTYGANDVVGVLAFGAISGGNDIPVGNISGLSQTNDSSANGAITFSTRASGVVAEKMRLDSSGNLGLGVTPSAWRSGTPAFQIGSSGVCLFSDSSVAAGLGNNMFLNSSSEYRYLRTDAASRYQQYQGVHSFLTAASGTAGDEITTFGTRVAIDSDGLKFNGDTAAANALDDYEQGTWTPTIVDNANNESSGQTYSFQNGAYTKIGRQVTAHFQVALSAAGAFGASVIRIGGLPVAAGSGLGVLTLGYWAGMASNVIEITGQTISGNTVCDLGVITAAATAQSGFSVSLISSTTRLDGVVIYYV
jgi:hypothetical protein